MKFDETDPATWTDPHFHPDWRIDSAKQVDMLRKCCIVLINSVPDIITRLVVDVEACVLYCEITSDSGKLGELICLESLTDNSVRYGFFSETKDKTIEYEFYTEILTDMLHIILAIHEGKDLKILHEEYGEFQ